MCTEWRTAIQGHNFKIKQDNPEDCWPKGRPLPGLVNSETDQMGNNPCRSTPFQMQTSPSRPHTPNASSSRLSHPTPSHPITPQPGARHPGAAPIAQSLWKLFRPVNPKPSCPASPSYRHHSKGSCPLPTLALCLLTKLVPPRAPPMAWPVPSLSRSVSITNHLVDGSYLPISISRQ